MKLDISKVLIDNSAAINAGVAQIKLAVQEARKRARNAVEDMRRIGFLLVQQKESLPHGAWREWLEMKCPDLPYRTAARWMEESSKCAIAQTSAERGNGDVAHLTEDQADAIGLLTEPEQVQSKLGSSGSNPRALADGLAFLQRATVWFAEHDLSKQPDRSVKELFLTQARPIVELYRKIEQEIA